MKVLSFKKGAAIVLGLGIGLSALTACGQDDNQVYNDANKILEMTRLDIENNQPYSNDQLKQINEFIDKYSSLEMGTPQMQAYLDTIKAVEQFSDYTVNTTK